MKIKWICKDCAGLNWGRMPDGRVVIWHFEKCDVCKKDDYVTEAMDFMSARRKLHEENQKIKKGEKNAN